MVVRKEFVHLLFYHKLHPFIHTWLASCLSLSRMRWETVFYINSNNNFKWVDGEWFPSKLGSVFCPLYFIIISFIVIGMPTLKGFSFSKEIICIKKICHFKTFFFFLSNALLRFVSKFIRKLMFLSLHWKDIGLALF